MRRGWKGGRGGTGGKPAACSTGARLVVEMEGVVIGGGEGVGGRGAGEVVVDEAAPGVAGGDGDEFLDGVATIAAHEEAVMEGGAFAEAGDDEVVHAAFEATIAADGAVGEAVVHVDGFVLEVGEALFGFVGELLHHGHAAVVAESVFEDALALFVGFGDLEAAGEVGEGFATAGAMMEGTLFVVRVEFGRNGRR
jgi:hypothetical protein